MIIECINCSKIFEVNSELIPTNGRTIQCGSCGHIWFYKHADLPNNASQKKISITKNNKSKIKPRLEEKILSKKIDEIINKKDTALIKYQGKSKLTILNFFGYIIVTIFTLISLVIILDTFQSQLSNFFPDLELILFNLYESIIDMYLFSIDLIK